MHDHHVGRWRGGPRHFPAQARIMCHWQPWEQPVAQSPTGSHTWSENPWLWHSTVLPSALYGLGACGLTSTQSQRRYQVLRQLRAIARLGPPDARVRSGLACQAPCTGTRACPAPTARPNRPRTSFSRCIAQELWHLYGTPRQLRPQRDSRHQLPRTRPVPAVCHPLCPMLERPKLVLQTVVTPPWPSRTTCHH